MQTYKVNQYSGWFQITSNIQIYYSNLKIKNRLRIYNSRENIFEEYLINCLPNKIKLLIDYMDINLKNIKFSLT